MALAHAQRTRIHAMCALQMSQRFAEKTFADGTEIEKNAKRFLPRQFSTTRYTATFTLQVVETAGKCGIEVLGGNV